MLSPDAEAAAVAQFRKDWEDMLNQPIMTTPDLGLDIAPGTIVSLLPNDAAPQYVIPPKTPPTITCQGCPHNDDCTFAWDLYNTDGDCLDEK